MGKALTDGDWGGTPRVFISHATADDDKVTIIHTRLTKDGIGVWVDHYRLKPSDDWNAGIQKALVECDFGLLVLSPRSAERPECINEWRTILDLKKPLYVALIEDVHPTIFPYRLRTIQYTRLIHDFEGGLHTLIEAIKDGKSIDPKASTTRRAISGSFPHWQLDLPLIGREDDLKAAEAMLQSGVRCAQVLGLGGIGKTRLAAEIATRADATQFKDGVIWHDMTGGPSLEMLIGLVRDHFNLAPTDDAWAELSRRAALLVLDNAEDCKDRSGHAALVNRLSLEGGTRVLMTSRYRWDEIRHAPARDLHAPTHEAARAILEAMVKAESPRYTPGDKAVILVEAARRHPKMLLYAVRWLKKYPPEHVINLLRNLKGMDAEKALEDLVNKTIRQMESESYGSEAKVALRRLAICRGGFTFEAAQAIMGAKADMGLLGLLTDWGLVTLEGGRYDIDPLVRAAAGEDEAAYQAHCDYYFALADKYDKLQAYLGLDPESANLEIAFERSMAAGEAEGAYWIANACHRFLANRGRFTQRKKWFERVAQALVRSDDERLSAIVQNSLGIIYAEQPIGNRRDSLKQAIDAFDKALKYYTPDIAPLDYAMTQNNLGEAYRNLAGIEDRAGNLKQAIDAFDKALKYYTPDIAPLDYAMTQNNLGIAYRNLAEIEDHVDNLRRAIAAFREALRFRTPDTAPLDYAGTQNNLGVAYAVLATFEDRGGNLKRAIDAYTEALRFYTPHAAPINHIGVQSNLGLAYRNLADVEERTSNLKRAIAVFREMLGSNTFEAIPVEHAAIHNNLGLVYHALAQVEERTTNLRLAVASYGDALRFYLPTEPLYYAMTQANKGIVHMELGEIKTAAACWRQAEEYFRKIGAMEDADKMRQWIDDAGG